MILTCWNNLYPRLNSRVGMNWTRLTDRGTQQSKDWINFGEEEGCWKEEGREEEEKNKDRLTKEGLMQTD